MAWYSRERVYRYDSDGNVAGLLYGKGDEIPEDEAVRQGLVAPTKKVAASAVQNKARTAATTSTKKVEG